MRCQHPRWNGRRGVFVSYFYGARWMLADGGLFGAPVYSLFPRGLYLYAGLNAGGLWRCPLSEITGTEATGIPKIALLQNYPNPFNPTTTIRFDLPREVHVKLTIYNVKRELVTTLVDQRMTEGRKEIPWTARCDRGRDVASGIYFYRLTAGEFVLTRKMVLLR